MEFCTGSKVPPLTFVPCITDIYFIYVVDQYTQILGSFYCKYRITTANKHCTERLLSPWLKTWDNNAKMYHTNLLLQVKCSHRNTPQLNEVQQLLAAAGFFKIRQKFYIREKCYSNSAVVTAYTQWPQNTSQIL